MMIQTFRDSISHSKSLRTLHNHCVNDLRLPGNYDDLLRMGYIYCLSALDKLVHDLVVHYMVETFSGRRFPTPKYLMESISMENHSQLKGVAIPPPEIAFESIVRKKLSYQSFMAPENLVDALSLVWNETHKWQTIAEKMQRDRKPIITELRNIFIRRNGIVHETDRDATTNNKMPIQTSDAERVEDFVMLLGESIYELVKNGNEVAV